MAIDLAKWSVGFVLVTFLPLVALRRRRFVEPFGPHRRWHQLEAKTELLAETELLADSLQAKTERRDALKFWDLPVATVPLKTMLADEDSFLSQLQRQLEGCHHAFFDLGANIGVHTRFLFEPELYPENAYHKIAHASGGEK